MPRPLQNLSDAQLEKLLANLERRIQPLSDWRAQALSEQAIRRLDAQWPTPPKTTRN